MPTVGSVGPREVAWRGRCRDRRSSWPFVCREHEPHGAEDAGREYRIAEANGLDEEAAAERPRADADVYCGGGNRRRQVNPPRR